MELSYIHSLPLGKSAMLHSHEWLTTNYTLKGIWGGIVTASFYDMQTVSLSNLAS